MLWFEFIIINSTQTVRGRSLDFYVYVAIRGAISLKIISPEMSRFPFTIGKWLQWEQFSKRCVHLIATRRELGTEREKSKFSLFIERFKWKAEKKVKEGTIECGFIVYTIASDKCFRTIFDLFLPMKFLMSWRS